MCQLESVLLGQCSVCIVYYKYCNTVFFIIHCHSNNCYSTNFLLATQRNCILNVASAVHTDFWKKPVCTTQGHLMKCPSFHNLPLCWAITVQWHALNGRMYKWIHSHILPLQCWPMCKMFTTRCTVSSITENLCCQMTTESLSTALQVICHRWDTQQWLIIGCSSWMTLPYSTSRHSQ